MKLGIFDSGLGGLIITRAIRDLMPELDIFYFGDTLHLPYGNRSDAVIYEYTRQAMDYMFEEGGCGLIVIACNTASAAALRKLQQEYLPAHRPDKNIIGVVVPTLENAIDQGFEKLGLIGTNYIINSNIYANELKKLNDKVTIAQVATPLLVPLMESDGLPWVSDVLSSYLKGFKKDPVEALILGCTHYAFLKPYIRQILGGGTVLLSQDEIIPLKLQDYLRRHPEYNDLITRNGRDELYVSDLTPHYVQAAHMIYGEKVDIKKAGLPCH